jgi:amino-acid N-acetyltransferase
MRYSDVKTPFNPSTVREAFSYLRRFKGDLFLVKLEDSLIHHPLFPLFMKDLVMLHHVGIKVILVPGIKHTINKYLTQFKIDTQYKDGIRVTSSESLPLIRLATMDVSQELMSHLTAEGSKGLIGNWVRARSMGVVDGIDFEKTGKVTRIQSDVLREVIDNGFIPIIPNLGWNDLGDIYNLNSNEVALQLCLSLGVKKLFFVGDEPGISVNSIELPENIEEVNKTRKNIISSLDFRHAESLLQLNLNILSHQMKDYLSKAVGACKGGVQRTHIVSGISEGSILQEVFSTQGEGTMIYINEYTHLRLPTHEDIPELLRFMQDFVQQKFLVSRTPDQVSESLKDFLVYEVDRMIIGCGALHMDTNSETGELAAIAVDTGRQSSGVGVKIVQSLLKQAEEHSLKKVWLFTTQAIDWFAKLGFRKGELNELPEFAQERYNKQRNSIVMIYDL